MCVLENWSNTDTTFLQDNTLNIAKYCGLYKREVVMYKELLLFATVIIQ